MDYCFGITNYELLHEPRFTLLCSILAQLADNKLTYFVRNCLHSVCCSACSTNVV